MASQIVNLFSKKKTEKEEDFLFYLIHARSHDQAQKAGKQIDRQIISTQKSFEEVFFFSF